MGQKKKTPASRSKHSPSSSSSAAATAAKTAEVESSDVSACTIYDGGFSRPASNGDIFVSAEVKLECEKALMSFQRGSYTKAIRTMKLLCSRHQDSALTHRVQGTVYVKVASVFEDLATKQKHLRNAIESARKAVELSPNSIEFAHFYANLLFEAANDGREYDEVMHECQKALAIENPIDPAKESLQDANQQKLSTPEARITHVQDELNSLVQKSNISSISTWMKHLGSGADSVRLIPIRRTAEDPIESNMIQARRPNEIKKANKTDEEKRKEIEVRVAAAKLMQQQKAESSPSENVGTVNNKGSDQTLGTGQRSGERRKHGNTRKNGNIEVINKRVRSYWDSMSRERKKELLRVKVRDLKSHFSASKDGEANEIISEALLFCEAKKTWRFWVCCRCSEKFVDSESHMQHIVQEHMGNVLPKMQMVLPQSLDNERIEILLSSSWKPLDLSAAVKLLYSQQRNSEFSEYHSPDITEETDDCFKDAWNDTSTEKEFFEDTCNGYDEHDESEKGKLSDSFPLPDGWPISDDIERAKLLEKIRAAFELLIRHKYLAVSHYDKVIQFTLDELRNVASVSQFLNRGLGQSPTCIFFLGATQLMKILKFLKDLSQACGLSRYSEQSNPNYDVISGELGPEVKEEILLDGENSCLLLDEKMLGTECIQETNMGSASNNGDIASSGDIANGNNRSFGDDGFLSWIFRGPSSEEQIVSWMRTKEEKMNQGLEIMQMLEKEFCHLQNLGERKCEYLSYEGALQSVEDLCLDEGRKRETSTEFTHESFDYVLRKRREELNESGHELVFMSSRFELDAITNVLKDADSLNHKQFGYEESYACTSSQLRDMESGEVDEWGIKDSFNESDSFIEIAIQKQKEQLSAELGRIDAQMMRNVTGMQQLELKLGHVSSNGYHIVLLSLLKSYMRAHLEALEEKDATEKSDAAREALIAEEDRDSKEARGRNENSKHTQEKSKDKKKIKDTKKLKELKASIGDDHRFNVDSAEHSLPSAASSGDHTEADVVSEAVKALKEQEDEYRRRIELHKEEQKLEKTLEYQRRIENEAKEKHIAEQQKKKSSLVSMNITEAVYNVCTDNVVNDFDLQEQDKSLSQENGVQSNGLPHVLHVSQVNRNGVFPPANHCALTDASMVEDVKFEKVVPNVEATEAVVSQSDQRTGRRSRRQKVSNKLGDEKCLVAPSESKNCESHRPGTDNKRQSDTLCSNGDAGTKTLRQLQAEEDEEERFQADYQKAVRQSLDAYQGGRYMTPGLRTPLEIHNDGLLADVTMEPQSLTEVAIYGTGLQNEVGEYNCFLNVIIQSLWNLELFRAEFLQSSTLEHNHVGDPCVVCSLYEIFTALSIASSETRKEPVAPSSLRIALSNLYPESSFFQEAQMNDASEVLAVIFDCLHRSFSQSPSDSESSESNSTGSWDCANRTCIAHSLFGMDIAEQLNCYSCGLVSRHLKYTSFFHNINASALRTMKVTCAENSLDGLLNLVEMNHQVTCDPEAGGCGKPNHIHHILTTPPHVFTTVLGWQNTCETVQDIAATLAALNTEIDISIIYRGLEPKCVYRLVSVVCYYGQHYHCFAYSHEHGRWIMYDDKTVKVVGSWSDVLSMCERGHLQPQVLLYEKH